MLAEIDVRCLLVKTNAVLGHCNINGRHVLLTHPTHCKRARSELIAGIAFKDNDRPGKAIASEIPGDAGPDNASADDHDIRTHVHPKSVTPPLCGCVLMK